MENKIAKIIEKRSGTWPEYYDEKDVENYCEYFIKGTNMKLGFSCFNKENNEWEYCRIVSESYDDFIYSDTEEELYKDFEYILMNENFSWRYYD